MDISVEIEGFEQAMFMLQNLTDEIQKKASNKGLSKAAQIVKKRAKANVRRLGLVRTGALHDEMSYASLRHKPGYPAVVLVGILRKGAQKMWRKAEGRGKRPFYWIFHEKGYTLAKNKQFYPGKRFLADALWISQKDVLSTWSREVQRFINEDVPRMAKAGQRVYR